MIVNSTNSDPNLLFQNVPGCFVSASEHGYNPQFLNETAMQMARQRNAMLILDHSSCNRWKRQHGFTGAIATLGNGMVYPILDWYGQVRDYIIYPENKRLDRHDFRVRSEEAEESLPSCDVGKEVLRWSQSTCRTNTVFWFEDLQCADVASALGYPSFAITSGTVHHPSARREKIYQIAMDFRQRLDFSETSFHHVFVYNNPPEVWIHDFHALEVLSSAMLTGGGEVTKFYLPTDESKKSFALTQFLRRFDD